MRLLAIAACVLFTSTPVSADDAAKEWEKLTGTWKLQEKGGKEDYPWGYINKNGHVVIAKDKVTLVVKEKGGETKLAEFSAKIDATKSPKTVTLTIESVAPEGDKAKEKGKKIEGIYALDGDTLKFLAGDEKNPPKAFPAKGDEGVSTMKREKAK
jgi:uncharacterized protein (TIGR03067 family)